MTGSNRLPTLAAEIRKAHADVQDAAKTAAQRAIEAGHALLEAKGLVKHGEWLPWLREHCALADRTARLYIQIAKVGIGAEGGVLVAVRSAANDCAYFSQMESEIARQPWSAVTRSSTKRWKCRRAESGQSLSVN
jgi:hypothetical protein